MSDPQRADAPHISEPLSWKQICELYPDEWVALAEVDWVNDTDFEFGTARVVGHGKQSRKALEQARAFSSRYTSMGHFFTGRVQAPMSPLLFP